MIKKIFSLLVFSTLWLLNSNAQSLTPEQYIELYKDFAIREMKRMGVPAAITLAQGLLETESGNSVLVKKSNNHFGIKCKSNWTAGGVSHDDDAPGECFRTYKDAGESYRDHSNFLRGNDRYAFLFNLEPTDYKGWAHGLKKAGYATNPKYPNILIKSIERYNLQQYNSFAAGAVPKFESGKYKDDSPVVFDPNEQIKTDKEDDYQNAGALNKKNDAEERLANTKTSGTINNINGNKCIWAAEGTSLLAIASRHNVNLKKLLDFNDMEEDGILETGQLIFLEKKSEKGSKQFYVVTQKETYYDVAQKNGIQLQYILEYNQVNEDAAIYPGKKIYLQPVAESDQANAILNSESTARTLHEVKPREGLYTVARKHGVTIQQLRDWNNLSSDELKIGQQLIIKK